MTSRDDWDASDDLNQALSAANACLYASRAPAFLRQQPVRPGVEVKIISKLLGLASADIHFFEGDIDDTLRQAGGIDGAKTQDALPESIAFYITMPLCHYVTSSPWAFLSCAALLLHRGSCALVLPHRWAFWNWAPASKLHGLRASQSAQARR